MQHIRRFLFVLMWLAVVSLAMAASLERFSVQEVHQFITTTDDPVAVLDVRTPTEYASGHIARSLLYNFDDEGFERKLSLLPRNFIFVVYCATGYRSIRTARMLKKMGYNVIHMDGGIEEWKRLQYPIVK